MQPQENKKKLYLEVAHDTGKVCMLMAWDSKFIGGHLEINNNYGAQVTAYSKTDNDKRSFCNCEHSVIEAWWQGPEVYVEDDSGHQYIFTSECNAR